MLHEHDSIPLCTAHETHHDVIDKIELPDDEHFFDLAEFFSVMGDSTRIKILYLLFEGEMCVCDISEALGMTMSAVSHQLRVLRDANLVKNRREGRVMYYRLCDDHVRTIIETAIEHVVE